MSDERIRFVPADQLLTTNYSANERTNSVCSTKNISADTILMVQQIEIVHEKVCLNPDPYIVRLQQ